MSKRDYLLLLGFFIGIFVNVVTGYIFTLTTDTILVTSLMLFLCVVIIYLYKKGKTGAR